MFWYGWLSAFDIGFVCSRRSVNLVWIYYASWVFHALYLETFNMFWLGAGAGLYDQYLNVAMCRHCARTTDQSRFNMPAAKGILTSQGINHIWGQSRGTGQGTMDLLEHRAKCQRRLVSHAPCRSSNYGTSTTCVPKRIYLNHFPPSLMIIKCLRSFV